MSDQKKPNSAQPPLAFLWLMIVIVAIVLTQSGDSHGQISSWLSEQFRN